MIAMMIVWVLFSIAEAYEDSEYEVIRDHKPTVYPRIAAGALVLVMWMMSHHYQIIKGAELALILSSVFWFVFELSGNIFRGHYFYFIGTTSSIDRALKRYEYPVFWLRLWLVALAFCLFYYNELLSSYL